jgi:hypothetical protein
MRTIETKIFTIDDHPNEEKCFDYIRENIFDLNEHSLMDAIESIKMLTNFIGGKNDYSISQSPCRGEYVKFTDYDKESLMELDADECPLTGVWTDAELIESMQKYGNADGLINAIHDDTEYIYSDEGLRGLCECNQWEFTEEGQLY